MKKITELTDLQVCNVGKLGALANSLQGMVSFWGMGKIRPLPDSRDSGASP
jgi:hypothetical protein